MYVMWKLQRIHTQKQYLCAFSVLYVHEIAARLKTHQLGNNCRMTERLLENLKAPNILLKTYNRSFGNKELFIRLTTSSILWDTVQSSCKSVLSHHPMHSLWKKMCSTSAGFKPNLKDILLSGSKYLFVMLLVADKLLNREDQKNPSFPFFGLPILEKHCQAKKQLWGAPC